MDQQEDYRKTLSDIRNLMDTSSRFHSVSGLSGISSGIAALLGIAVFYVHFGFGLFDPFLFVNYLTVPFLMVDGLVVLLLSIVFALFFTYRNAKKNGEKTWTKLSKRVLLYWVLPMIAGGIILLPYFSGSGPILFPSAIALSLVFYGLALISASRFSLNELFWLGLIQLILGITGFFLWKYSLICWAMGFGVMNVVFGALVYRRYEVGSRN
ncbi:MAG: hypothetical protein HXX13_10300 [Bacteroidetes bacterium]|nr:hypothetical protein [Bacteroidota bacterium]